ncbi:hypothetical protein, partial [Halomonas sp.]|uniref:hypothetical protein n=1 Tax=Halomonas sp. TaxID=1486246 RepID=UPI0035699517
QAWPVLALGTGTWLLAAIGLRMLAELCLLPHHLAALRQGFTPGSVVTRSFERRPAVHSEEATWTSESYPLEEEGEAVGEAVGKARVARPAQRLRPRGASNEPTLDLAGDQSEIPPYREPHL